MQDAPAAVTCFQAQVRPARCAVEGHASFNEVQHGTATFTRKYFNSVRVV
jgi:hypothetical protein